MGSRVIVCGGSCIGLAAAIVTLDASCVEPELITNTDFTDDEGWFTSSKPMAVTIHPYYVYEPPVEVFDPCQIVHGPQKRGKKGKIKRW